MTGKTKNIALLFAIILGLLGLIYIGGLAGQYLHNYHTWLDSGGLTGQSAMKSRAMVRNALFQAIRRSESIILTDPKGELYADTAELFRQNGYEVRVYNLVHPEHGDSWNCMSDLQGDTLMAQMLTNVIIGNTSSGKGDHFWDNGEANLLKALILYVDQDQTREPEQKYLPAVYARNEFRSGQRVPSLLRIWKHTAEPMPKAWALSSTALSAGAIPTIPV